VRRDRRPRFPTPLVKPDVPICGIRFSDSVNPGPPSWAPGSVKYTSGPPPHQPLRRPCASIVRRPCPTRGYNVALAVHPNPERTDQSMPRPRIIQPWLLGAALVGLEQSRQRVEAQITQIKGLLAPRRGPTPAPAAGKPKRTISAAGRRRIAAAQRKRWAALKKAKGESAPKKRRLSPEGRRHIIEATRKRWAELRAKKAAKEAKASAEKVRKPSARKAAKPSAQPAAAE